VPAENDADRLRLVTFHRRDVQPELETRPPPRNPDHPVAETPLRQRFTVGGRGQGDTGVGMQMVDVRGVDEAVHRGVDGRRGPALAVQAVVERGDHLVLALGAGVDVRQGAQPVQAEHGEPVRGEGAEVAARALHPQQTHSKSTGCRVTGSRSWALTEALPPA